MKTIDRTQTHQERKDAIRDELRLLIINNLSLPPDQRPDAYRQYMSLQSQMTAIEQELDEMERAWS